MHRLLRPLVALTAGLLLAFFAYERVTDPQPRQQRRLEEQVVASARALLNGVIASGSELDIVDPLAPDRKVGKAYIYPTPDGWEVSGHYRRRGETDWHPWLMTLDRDRSLVALSVRDADPALARRAGSDPRLTAAE